MSRCADAQKGYSGWIQFKMSGKRSPGICPSGGAGTARGLRAKMEWHRTKPPPRPTSRPPRHFANVWQNRAKFAEHWQIHPPRRFRILPNIGKIIGNLPNIGKTASGAAQSAVHPHSLLPPSFSLNPVHPVNPVKNSLRLFLSAGKLFVFFALFVAHIFQ